MPIRFSIDDINIAVFSFIPDSLNYFKISFIDSQTGTSVRYSQEGSLLNTTRWEEGRKVWEEKFEYTDKFLSGSVAREVVTGEKTSRKYDSAGNITYIARWKPVSSTTPSQAKPATNVAKTGDQSNAGMWIGILAIAVLVALIAVLVRVRSKNK